MELVILVGLQAAGKSTFARERFGPTHAYVSKDAMPDRGGRERRQRALVEAALRAGKSVVVDNTNPRREDRAALIELGRAHGAEIVGYFFAPELKASLVRNRGRAGGARVPDIALFATIKKLARPSYEEGFDRLYGVRLADGAFEVEAWPVAG